MICGLDDISAKLSGVDTLSAKTSRYFAGEGAGNHQPSKRGPKRGKIARFLADDLKLCPAIEGMTRNGKMSVQEAIKELDEKKRIPGTGTRESRRARVGNVYRDWKKLAPAEKRRLQQN
jgi:hypothetical protein